MFRSILAFSIFVTFSAGCLRADNAEADPNLLPGDFESGTTTYNPWAGVDDQGSLHVIAGSQLAVSDSGTIEATAFSPSVAVGDLNGNGLPDLVVADARGFFWFFPNSGKPNAPVFTHGEIMPIWLGGGEGEGDAVPRIQLVDFTTDVRICYSLNTGTPGSPKFGPLVPFRGLHPYPKIIAPSAWIISRYRPDGAPYELLECTNASVEQGFTPPPDPFQGSPSPPRSGTTPKATSFLGASFYSSTAR